MHAVSMVRVEVCVRARARGGGGVGGGDRLEYYGLSVAR